MIQTKKMQNNFGEREGERKEKEYEVEEDFDSITPVILAVIKTLCSIYCVPLNTLHIFIPLEIK